MPEIAGVDPRPAGTIGEAVRRLAQSFREAGLDTPELDARVLVAEGARVERAVLLSSPERLLTADAKRNIAAYQARRLRREPVSRILGRREFRGRTFEIAASTLDPRPDTESVVGAALDLVPMGGLPDATRPRILDLGTGSGAILITLLADLPGATGLGTDIDPAALQIAARNASRHGVADRAALQAADWLQDVAGNFDVVVCNPPYVATEDIPRLEPEVAGFDPRRALDGGADGLACYREIIPGAHKVLRRGGWLLLEVGAGQADRVHELCQEHGFGAAGASWREWNDLAGRRRCVATKTRRL